MVIGALVGYALSPLRTRGTALRDDAAFGAHGRPIVRRGRRQEGGRGRARWHGARAPRCTTHRAIRTHAGLSPFSRAQVVLKIIKHCQEALPSFVTGQLLGLDIGRTLEVTNCFPFPNKNEDAAAPAAGTEAEDGDEDGAEYQMHMMQCLREVNVDNNTVGWYQSTYFSSFIDDSCIDTQFNYQARDAAEEDR